MVALTRVKKENIALVRALAAAEENKRELARQLEGERAVAKNLTDSRAARELQMKRDLTQLTIGAEQLRARLAAECARHDALLTACADHEAAWQCEREALVEHHRRLQQQVQEYQEQMRTLCAKVAHSKELAIKAQAALNKSRLEYGALMMSHSATRTSCKKLEARAALAEAQLKEQRGQLEESHVRSENTAAQLHAAQEQLEATQAKLERQAAQQAAAEERARMALESAQERCVLLEQGIREAKEHEEFQRSQVSALQETLAAAAKCVSVCVAGYLRLSHLQTERRSSQACWPG
jgi:hypothetical protein